MSARPDGKQVQIQVADTGSGIPAADLPHVFERFYRSAETRAEAGDARSEGARRASIMRAGSLCPGYGRCRT
jgi:signal transduction histidine kinase